MRDPSFTEEDPTLQQRIREMLNVMKALSTWSEKMLQLEPSTLMRIMKLGDRIQKLVSGRKRDA